MPLVPDIAPEVFRQRLLVEGRFTRALDREIVGRLLLDLADALGMRAYGDPIVYSPDGLIEFGEGKEENAGYDAFLPLVDSGITAYFWTGPKFFSLVIYTCAAFDADRAAEFVREALAVEGEMVHAGF